VETSCGSLRITSRTCSAGRSRSTRPTWAEGRPILEAYGELQALLEQASYTADEKARIVALLTALGLLKSDESRWVILRRTRGQLVTRSRDGTVRVTADGRGDWIGWLELKREAVNEDATRNTARVVGDMAADVLAVIEAEDRPALQRFNEDCCRSASRPARRRGATGT
jgi:hypothetical protein